MRPNKSAALYREAAVTRKTDATAADAGDDDNDDDSAANLLVHCGIFVQHLYGVLRVTNTERVPRRLCLEGVHLRIHIYTYSHHVPLICQYFYEWRYVSLLTDVWSG